MNNYEQLRDKDGTYRFLSPGLVVKYYPTTGTVFVQEGALPKRPNKFKAVNLEQVIFEVHRYSEQDTPSKPTTGLTCDGSTTNRFGAQARVTTAGGLELETKRIASKAACNNVIAELYGIGMGVKIAANTNETVVYCDCKPAITISVPGYKFTEGTDLHKQIVTIVQGIRKKNPGIEVLKWNKDLWGEIPSDFGYK